MTIELARTFRALDMWQSPAHIAAHLDRANALNVLANSIVMIK